MLDDPKDRTSVMISFSTKSVPDMTIDELESLGDLIQPPQGWKFHTTTLNKDLVLEPKGGFAGFTQDDKGNVYALTGPRLSHFVPETAAGVNRPLRHDGRSEDAARVELKQFRGRLAALQDAVGDARGNPRRTSRLSTACASTRSWRPRTAMSSPSPTAQSSTTPISRMRSPETTRR